MADTHEITVNLYIGDGSHDDAELEVYFEADIVPYRPATGPTHGCAGEPAEEGHVELTGAFFYPYAVDGDTRLAYSHQLDWLLKTLSAATLEGIAQAIYDDFKAAQAYDAAAE